MTRHRLDGGGQRTAYGGESRKGIAGGMSGGWRVARWLSVLLVVSGLTTVASGAVSGTAGAADASAGGCISAHPPSLYRVGPTKAVVIVEYKDNCAFPAEVGVKFYRPGGGFLKETRKSTQNTVASFKETYFDLTDLPPDKLIRMQSLVENFGTAFSSTVDFMTSFAHPSSLRLDATPIRSGANDAPVHFTVVAGGLLERPFGSTDVIIQSSLNGRSLETVAAKFSGCQSQEFQCTWAYSMQNLPVRSKLTVTATFNNETYADSFPNMKTTKPFGVIVGSGNNCAATTEKVLYGYCAP